MIQVDQYAAFDLYINIYIYISHRSLKDELSVLALQFSIHSKAGVAAFGAALAFLYLAPSRGLCSSRLQP